MIHINSYRSYPVINGVDIDSNLTYDPTKDKARLGSDRSGIYISTGNGNAQVERFRMLNNGNIGIGTTNPSYKLQVNGDINFTGGLYQNGALFSSGGSGGGGGTVDLSSYSQKSQNLADLTNLTTARANLGLNGILSSISMYLLIDPEGFNATAHREISLKASPTPLANSLAAYDFMGWLKANALVTTTLIPSPTEDTITCTARFVCGENNRIYGGGEMGTSITLESVEPGAGAREYIIYSTGSGCLGGAGLFQIYDQTGSRPILNIDANRYTTIYNDLTIEPGDLMNSAINMYGDDGTKLQIQTSGGNLFFNNLSAPVTGTTDQYWRLNLSRNGFLTAAKDITALGNLRCQNFVVDGTSVNHGNKNLKNSNVIRTLYTLSRVVIDGSTGSQNTGVSSSLPPNVMSSFLPFIRWTNTSLNWTARMAVGFMYNGETTLSLVFLYASSASPSERTMDNTRITLAIYSKSGTYVCSANVNILNSNMMAPFIDPVGVGIDLVSNALVKGEQYAAMVFDKYVNVVLNGISYPAPFQIDLRNVEMFLTY